MRMLIIGGVVALALAGCARTTTPAAAGSSQACQLFTRWLPTAGYNEGTQTNAKLPGILSLLRQAVADADGNEAASQASLSLSADLSGLLEQVQLDQVPYSPLAWSDEQNVMNDCAAVRRGE
jgi:hypothetical protein